MMQLLEHTALKDYTAIATSLTYERDLARRCPRSRNSVAPGNRVTAACGTANLWRRGSNLAGYLQDRQVTFPGRWFDWTTLYQPTEGSEPKGASQLCWHRTCPCKQRNLVVARK